jgi:hypothetical protein
VRKEATIVCLDWLSYEVSSKFQKFWVEKGFACIHVTKCDGKFAQPCVAYPWQRDSYGCAYYAVLAVVEVLTTFTKSNVPVITTETFHPDLYRPAYYCYARKKLFNLITYCDGAEVLYLNDNPALLRYLNSRMFAITIYVFSLFSPSLFEDGD